MAAKLRSALDASVAEVTDLSGGCGATYRVVIVSPQFEGLSLVKQHKLVKATLKEDIAEMHALTLKTYTPAKYEAERT
ncbi:unnamed protein product [Symbiodinium sp. KB8]|nr:unnamed protein product [Symbiodinium sp. KB8]